MTASISKINLIPKHIWEPVMQDLMGKPENAEQLKEPSRIGSGPFKAGALGGPRRKSCSSATPGTFQAPQGRTLDHAHRAQRRGDARHVEARRDQFSLGMFGGDPEVLVKFAKENPEIVVALPRSISAFEYVAFKPTAARRSTTLAFRRALSLSIDRKPNGPGGRGRISRSPANSHVSPALAYWHAPKVDNLKYRPRRREADPAAGRLSAWVGGKLYYPAGKTETLTTE